MTITRTWLESLKIRLFCLFLEVSAHSMLGLLCLAPLSGIFHAGRPTWDTKPLFSALCAVLTWDQASSSVLCHMSVASQLIRGRHLSDS